MRWAWAVLWTRPILGTERKEDGEKQKGTHKCLQTYLWSLGGLETSLAQAQAAGAAGRSQEGLEEANKGITRPEPRETRERFLAMLLRLAQPASSTLTSLARHHFLLLSIRSLEDKTYNEGSWPLGAHCLLSAHGPSPIPGHSPQGLG